MTDKEKNIVSKLEVIKELATEKSVQQLCQVQIEYIKLVSKGDLGFKENE